MRKGIRPVGSYVLIKDYEQIKDKLYKGIVHMSNNSNTQFDDIVHFNYEDSIDIPEHNLIAVKWYEVIFKEVYIEEPEIQNLHLAFNGLDSEL